MKFENCIICFKPINKQTPPEHVLPHYLGGRLKGILLCKECNNGIGAKLYSQIKFDAHIRRATYILKEELPQIYLSVERQQIYTTLSPVGTKLKAKRTNTGIHVIPQTDGNWTVLPTKNAVKYLEQKLIEEHGKSSKEAFSISREIQKTPNKEFAKFREGYTTIRWDGEMFQPDYSSNTICEERVILLIAYEFLALLLGNGINEKYFNNVRNMIIYNQMHDLIKVDFFTSSHPQPYHLIYPEFENDRTVINIHLFEYVIFKVQLINLHIENSPDFCYLEDLVNRTSLGAISVAEGKANRWKLFDVGLDR